MMSQRLVASMVAIVFGVVGLGHEAVLAGGLADADASNRLIYEGHLMSELSPGDRLTSSGNELGINTGWGWPANRQIHWSQVGWIGSAVVAGGSLAYVDTQGRTLITSGHSAVISPEPTNRKVHHYSRRYVVDPKKEEGLNRGTLWISMVLKPQSPDNNAVRFADSNTTLFELVSVASSTDGSGVWRLNSRVDEVGVDTDVPGGDDVFVLIKIAGLGGKDANGTSISVWLNPLLGSEPDTVKPDAQLENLQGNHSFNRIVFYQNVWNHIDPEKTSDARARGHSFGYDEIRMGTTCWSVMPYIPAPDEHKTRQGQQLIGDPR